MATVHAALLAWSGWRHSPCYDELGHLAAGVSHWELGRFDLYPVNPPLVRMVASVPVALAGSGFDWRYYNDNPKARAQHQIGKVAFQADPERTMLLLTIARWACIPLSVLGGCVCYLFARDLYGSRAGVMAACLWFFCPNVLGHGALVSPDVGAAAMGVTALYLFWRWLGKTTWGWTLAAGAGLGGAELSKTTWIILFGVLPLVWIAARLSEEGVGSRFARLRQESLKLAVILLLGIFAINAGYAFEGSFQRLGQYEFHSTAFGGAVKPQLGEFSGTNRYAGTWAADVPVPLPKNYVVGIDFQKSDFERGMWSYLRGQWRQHGWWYYYLYGLAIKVPLGTWTIVLLAAGASLLSTRYRASWRDDLVVLTPAIALLVFVSAQTSMTHNVRYVLPMFPFVFVWASKVAGAFEVGWARNARSNPLAAGEGVRRHRVVAVAAAAALAWAVTSSLTVYPHSLSYFNELVGGPAGGPAHLLDSNIDWGQDLWYLNQWVEAHPEASPLRLTFHGTFDARLPGVESAAPPPRPTPGWYALSVTEIRSPSPSYEYFLRCRPVATAGYSIYVYHVTLDDANRVRRELGLPKLPRP